MHSNTLLNKSVLVALLFSSLCAVVPAIAADNAPEFTLAGHDQPVSLTALRGKVVYLDFWASWCGPCRKSFPWMNTMQQRYRDQGLAVVAINLDKDRALSDKFLKEVPTDFTIGYDPDGMVAVTYKVKGMPSSYLIDRDGRIQDSHIGFREENTRELEASIQTLLQKKTATRP